VPLRNFSFIPRQKMAFHVPEQRVGGVFAASRSETLVAMFVAMLNRLCAANSWPLSHVRLLRSRSSSMRIWVIKD
jgi:hypothetical protein